MKKVSSTNEVKMKKSYKEFLDIAMSAAKTAGGIQMEKLGKIEQVRHKGEADLVTEVDVLCEKKIKEIILSNYPHHQILAEESGGASKGKYRWIVDPLDGTTNYAHGYPFFCTSIALEIDGVIVVGVVYNPVSGELFSAVCGGGAFLNGKPIHVSTVSKLENAMAGTGFPYEREKRLGQSLELFRRMIEPVQAIRRDGSAALNLCYVAVGRFDLFWELTLHPWDIAAGWLMIEEAGGKVTRIDGSPMQLDAPDIAASNSILHDELIKTLKGER